MRDNNRVIGGEFEIDLTQRGSFSELIDTYYYASGRAALYQILCSVNVNRIWLPDYLCSSIIDAVLKAGVQYVFYDLNDNLEPIFETLNADEFDAILLIDYFGLKDLNPIEDRLVSLFPYSVLIEDDVQAFFDFQKGVNQYVHYRFTSLRKTFAIPDGGLVSSKHRLANVKLSNSFSQYKLKAGDMKYHRSETNDDTKYLYFFEVGEKLINENYDSQMSPDSKSLFAACDFAIVGQKRKANAKYLIERIRDIGIKTILPVMENQIPLFVPIYLDNRDKVRKAMFRRNVFCPVHWPLNGMPVKKGAEMAEHELSLIVDQRYTTDDMDFILELLVRNK